MTAVISPSSIFDKSLPALARATQIPEAIAAAEYVGEWLAVLADDPARGGEFDRELDEYAESLAEAGVLVGDQRSGFLLALYARLYPTGPLQQVLRRVVDERKRLQGWRYCRWRGWLPLHEFDRWQYDRAAERAAMPSKFDH